MRWTLVPLVLVAGCDDYVTPAHPRDQTYAPDWQGMQELFADHCNSCHGVQDVYPPLPSGIVDDITREGRQLVVPGSPEDSRLWRTISGEITGADYATMPLGEPLLPAAMAEAVAEWIRTGADLGTDDPCPPEEARLWYPDADGDTWGADAPPLSSCVDPSTETLAYTPRPGDCNDADPAFFPGAEETDCTDINDYNCDGSVGAEDADEDGFFACEECDDTNPDIRPDADEVCNGVDDDCDRAVDDDDPSVDLTSGNTYFEDADLDGFGTDDTTRMACQQPTGFADEGSDCDDTDPLVNPGVPVDGPVADGVDNDCDETIDEDARTVSFSADVQPIMVADCVECHSRYDDRDFLLTATGDGFPLVVPGDADASYLYRKINGGPNIQGSRMPRGAPPLSSVDTQRIEAWIVQGAAE